MQPAFVTLAELYFSCQSPVESVKWTNELIQPQWIIVYLTVLNLSGYSDDWFPIEEGVVFRWCNLDGIYVCI